MQRHGQEEGCASEGLSVVGLGYEKRQGWQGCAHCAKALGLHVTVGSSERVWGKHQEGSSRPGLRGQVAASWTQVGPPAAGRGAGFSQESVDSEEHLPTVDQQGFPKMQAQSSSCPCPQGPVGFWPLQNCLVTSGVAPTPPHYFCTRFLCQHTPPLIFFLTEV